MLDQILNQIFPRVKKYFLFFEHIDYCCNVVPLLDNQFVQPESCCDVATTEKCDVISPFYE